MYQSRSQARGLEVKQNITLEKHTEFFVITKLLREVHLLWVLQKRSIFFWKSLKILKAEQDAMDKVNLKEHLKLCKGVYMHFPCEAFKSHGSMECKMESKLQYWYN